MSSDSVDRSRPMAVYAFSHIAVTADPRSKARLPRVYGMQSDLQVVCRDLLVLVDASKARGRWTKLTNLPVILRNTLAPMQTLGPIQIRRCANSCRSQDRYMHQNRARSQCSKQ